MKTLLISCILALTILVPTTGSSQQLINYEAGFRTSGFGNDVSFLFKRSTKENFYMRYQGSLSAGYSTFIPGDATFSGQLGFSVGFEWRKQLAERVQFLHGPMPGLSVAFLDGPSFDTWALQPKLGYILGFQYQLNDDLALGVELVPRFEGVVNDDLELDNVNFGLNTSSAGVFLVYRFGRTK